jgi:predicted TIM-barrel enzyme
MPFRSIDNKYQVVYNSGRFRMSGRGSLAGLMPYGNANAMTLEMAHEILTVVEKTPVLAGLCGTDPFRDISALLKEVKELGFLGVQVSRDGRETQKHRN